jgi:hypothetical protein
MNDAKQNVHRATEWLDDKLVPILGPAPNGPWEETASEDQHPGDADELCPVCHHAISQHTEEREDATGRVWLRCPDADTVIETHREQPDSTTQNGPLLS